MKRNLQNCPNFSQRSLKPQDSRNLDGDQELSFLTLQNLAVLVTTNFAKRFIQTSLNRKADVPTLLIPFVAIAICLAALFAFATFNNTLEGQSEQFAQLTGNIIFNENYIKAQAKLILDETLEKCPNCEENQLKEKFIELTKQKEEIFRYPPAENFYGKVFREEFNITNEGLLIENIFTEEKVGNNKIKRTFNITIENSKHL